MLTPYLPYPLVSGGQIRTYNLLKNLSRKHDITLFALIKDDREKDHLKQLEKFCKKIKVFKRSFSPWHPQNILRAGLTLYPFVVTRNLVSSTKAEVAREIAAHHYDLIHAETFYMMPNIPATDIPVILVEQTIEYLGYQSYADKTKWWFLKPLLALDIFKIKYWEKRYWRSCDHLITMSEEDKKFILSITPDIKHIDVVANGVDYAWFNQVKKQLPPQPTVLSVGTFKWLPNIEAVEFLVEKVWDLIKARVPNAKLWIVGNAPTPKVLAYEKRDPSIKVSGGIPDIREAYAGSHVLLAPVFSGKGTRYKILEALATGTPAVATSIAVEGIGITPEINAVVENSAVGLAEAVARVLGSPILQKKLAQNGKKFVFSHYDWINISQKLDRIYLQVGRRD